MQVLSDFDIFSIVGANKPLQLVDTKVSVKEEGVIHIRFEGVNGSPAVCGICLRKAAEMSGTMSFCLLFQFMIWGDKYNIGTY